MEKLTFPVLEKKHESLGFNIIDSGTVQRITTEYVIRWKQFHKWKLRWRTSKGSKKSLGWIPFKAESMKLSLQDVSGVFRRLTGRKLDLGQVLAEYDFGSVGRDLKSKPKFSLTVWGHHLSFFNPWYLAYYLRTLKAEIKGGSHALQPPNQEKETQEARAKTPTTNHQAERSAQSKDHAEKLFSSSR